MKILQKKNLKYLFLFVTFVLIILLGKEFLFNQVQGSTSTITATVSVNSIVIEAKAAPKSVFVGKDFSVRARIENKGLDTLNDVEATIYLPNGLILLSNETQYLGEIKAGRNKIVSWKINGQVAGNYVIIVSVSGFDEVTNELMTNEATTVVEVKEKMGGGLSIFSDFFLRIFNR